LEIQEIGAARKLPAQIQLQFVPATGLYLQFPPPLMLNTMGLPPGVYNYFRSFNKYNYSVSSSASATNNQPVTVTAISPVEIMVIVAYLELM
jgi:hypothetical protein